MHSTIPNHPDDLSIEFINELIGEMHPGVKVEEFQTLQIKGFGEANVSTSVRASLRLKYTGGPPANLPDNAILKMSMAPDEASEDVWCGRLYPYYKNEVEFYKRIRTELELESPRALGGRFDERTGRYALLLEDMTAQSVHFSSMRDDTTVNDVRSVLDVLARVHARFWQSPRFAHDLSWIPTHTGGVMEEHRRQHVYEGVRQEVALSKVKREILENLKTDAETLFAGVRLVKDYHAAVMPEMILHGDPHLGNTYLTRDGAGGLYDWQCFSRGFGIHDVTYHINTGLSIELRRKHERELLADYRESLRSYGVLDPPTLETLWLAHRRQALVSFCPGWFCTPVVNYGWEVLTVGLVRLSVAVQDLESQQAVAMLA